MAKLQSTMTDQSSQRDVITSPPIEHDDVIVNAKDPSVPIPMSKRVESYNTSICTGTSASVGDGSSSSSSSSSCDEHHDHQQNENVLSVDMFSRFATAYIYPSDGDSSSTGRGTRSDASSSSRLARYSPTSKRQDRCVSRSSLTGVKFLDDDDEHNEEQIDAEHNHEIPGATRNRRHRKTESLSCEPLGSGNKFKPDDDHAAYHQRTRTLPSSMYIDVAATALLLTPDQTKSSTDSPVGAACTPITPSPPRKQPMTSSHEKASNIAQQYIHRKKGSTPKLSPAISTSQLPQIGRPPRPNPLGRKSPAELSRVRSDGSAETAPTRNNEVAKPSHRRLNSAPIRSSQIIEKGPPLVPLLCIERKKSDLSFDSHLRPTSSYESFRDCAESLCESLSVSSLPDPQLIGRRRRHHGESKGHRRGPSGSTISSKSSTSISNDSLANKSTEDEVDAEWNAYYTKQKMKKNIVKEELKYRLGKISFRRSSGDQPDLVRSNAAKFV